MNKLKIVFMVSVCLFTALLFFLFSTGTRESNSFPQKQEASFGSADDPEARLRYEWMMLHDPKTGAIPPNIREKELAYAATLPAREQLNALGKGGAVRLANWSPRGPYNVGGRTRALAIDVSDATGNTILAGGVSGGMWRSTNGGTSWSRVTSLSLNVQSVTCIAQDTRAGKRIWYYGTGERSGNSAGGGGAPYLGDGIFKSTDGGVTWAVLSSTVSGTPQTWDGDFDYVWNIVTDPSNSTQDVVYAAVYGGIKRSTNGGTSWTNTSVIGDAGLLTGNFTDVATTTTGVLYATISSDVSTTKGIFRSPDGITWTNITPSNWPSVYNRIVIGIAPANQNVVYFLAETPGSGKNNQSIWKFTSDGTASGGTWVNRSANLPAFGPPVGDFDSQGSYDLVIKVKPDNENVVFIGGTNLYRSTDGFATSLNVTWIGGYATINDISSYTNHHPDQHALAFLPSNPAVLFSGHDGGISKTTNDLASTISWSFLNNGYYTTQFYAVAIDHATSGNSIMVGGLQDNGVWFTNSTSATANWVLQLSGDGAFCAIADSRTSYYVSTQNGSTYRLLLDNNGAPASNPYFTNVTPSGASGFLFTNPFVIDPNSSNRMYMAAGPTIWRNSDLTGIPLGSNNTTSVNWDSLTVSYVSGRTITALAISKTPANRLYYGTFNGFVYRIDGVSSGQPTQRINATSTLFPTNAYVSCIAIDPTNADNAIVVFSNYSVLSLFYTSNGGSTWTSVGGNLEQNPDGTGNGPSCRWASIVPVGSSKIYFVGTSAGLYSTNVLNGTLTVWALEGASTIGNVIVTMVDYRTSDGLVVAATHANGVYSANFVATSVEEHGTIPTEFVLEQNYPNPFNPSTSIRYNLSIRTDVKLDVLDVAGRRVVTLVSEEQNAGTYETKWDGRTSGGISAASGTYVYRLEAGGKSLTRKMVLLK